MERNSEGDLDEAVKEEINDMVDKLNQGSLELLPTIIAGYYLSVDGNKIVNDILTEEQHESIRRFTGV